MSSRHFSEVICIRKSDVSEDAYTFAQWRGMPKPAEQTCHLCGEVVLWDGALPPGESEATLRWVCGVCFQDRGGFRAGDNIALTPAAEELARDFGFDVEELLVLLPLIMES